MNAARRSRPDGLRLAAPSTPRTACPATSTRSCGDVHDAPAPGMVEPRKVAPRADHGSLRTPAQAGLAAPHRPRPDRRRRRRAPDRRARTRPAPPFGLAANGAVAYGQDGDIYRYDIAYRSAVAADQRPDVRLRRTFSRDGTRLAFGRIPADHIDDADPPLSIMVAGIDGSDIRELTGPVNGNCWSDWSPDGGRIVYRTQLPSGYGLLNVLDVATGGVDAPSTSARPSGAVASHGVPRTARRSSSGATTAFGTRSSPSGRTGPGSARSTRRSPAATATAAPRCHPMARPMTVTRWGDEGARIWLLDLNTGPSACCRSRRGPPREAAPSRRTVAFSRTPCSIA